MRHSSAKGAKDFLTVRIAGPEHDEITQLLSEVRAAVPSLTKSQVLRSAISIGLRAILKNPARSVIAS